MGQETEKSSMNNSPQEYYDVHLLFSCSHPDQTFLLLESVAKMYGYDVRKTIIRSRSNLPHKAIVRIHHSKQIIECLLDIERVIRKFVSVLSIEMERIDEADIVWWTKMSQVENEEPVASAD